MKWVAPYFATAVKWIKAVCHGCIFFLISFLPSSLPLLPFLSSLLLPSFHFSLPPRKGGMDLKKQNKMSGLTLKPLFLIVFKAVPLVYRAGRAVCKFVRYETCNKSLEEFPYWRRRDRERESVVNQSTQWQVDPLLVLPAEDLLDTLAAAKGPQAEKITFHLLLLQLAGLPTKNSRACLCVILSGLWEGLVLKKKGKKKHPSQPWIINPKRKTDTKQSSEQLIWGKKFFREMKDKWQ